MNQSSVFAAVVRPCQVHILCALRLRCSEWKIPPVAESYGFDLCSVASVYLFVLSFTCIAWPGPTTCCAPYRLGCSQFGWCLATVNSPSQWSNSPFRPVPVPPSWVSELEVVFKIPWLSLSAKVSWLFMHHLSSLLVSYFSGRALIHLCILPHFVICLTRYAVLIFIF